MTEEHGGGGGVGEEEGHLLLEPTGHGGGDLWEQQPNMGDQGEQQAHGGVVGEHGGDGLVEQVYLIDGGGGGGQWEQGQLLRDGGEGGSEEGVHQLHGGRGLGGQGHLLRDGGGGGNEEGVQQLHGGGLGEQGHLLGGNAEGGRGELNGLRETKEQGAGAQGGNISKVFNIFDISGRTGSSGKKRQHSGKFTSPIMMTDPVKTKNNVQDKITRFEEISQASLFEFGSGGALSSPLKRRKLIPPNSPSSKEISLSRLMNTGSCPPPPPPWAASSPARRPSRAWGARSRPQTTAESPAMSRKLALSSRMQSCQPRTESTLPGRLTPSRGRLWASLYSGNEQQITQNHAAPNILGMTHPPSTILGSSSSSSSTPGQEADQPESLAVQLFLASPPHPLQNTSEKKESYDDNKAENPKKEDKKEKLELELELESEITSSIRKVRKSLEERNFEKEEIIPNKKKRKFEKKEEAEGQVPVPAFNLKPYLHAPRPGATVSPSTPTVGSIRACSTSSSASGGSVAASGAIGLLTRGPGGNFKEIFKENSIRIDYAMLARADQTTAAYNCKPAVPAVTGARGAKTTDPVELSGTEQRMSLIIPGEYQPHQQRGGEYQED